VIPRQRGRHVEIMIAGLTGKRTQRTTKSLLSGRGAVESCSILGEMFNVKYILQQEAICTSRLHNSSRGRLCSPVAAVRRRSVSQSDCERASDARSFSELIGTTNAFLQHTNMYISVKFSVFEI